MKRYIVQRLLQGVVLLFMVATIVFFLGRLTGNPVDLMLPEDATPEDRITDDQGARARRIAVAAVPDLHRQCAARRSRQLHPHAPAGGGGVLLPPAEHAGDHSLGDPARHGLGIPLGVIASLNRGNILDRVAGTVAVLGIATPSFWLGIVLIFVFSVELGWLPSGRMGGPEHYVLPVITLAASSSPASCGWCAPACWR